VRRSFDGPANPEILWLVDGVRISNRLYNGTTPLDTIPAQMIERIEILEGGQGLFYGTQAVAGVINVVTRSFTDNTNVEIRGGGNTNKGGVLAGLARGRREGNRFVMSINWVGEIFDNASGFGQVPSGKYTIVDLGGRYYLDAQRRKTVFAFACMLPSLARHPSIVTWSPVLIRVFVQAVM